MAVAGNRNLQSPQWTHARIARSRCMRTFLPQVSSLTPQACSKNDRRSYVSENLRRSTTELRRYDLNQVAPVGLEPTASGSQSMYSNSAVDRCLQLFYYRSGRRGSRTLKACHASSAGFQPDPVAIRFALPFVVQVARPGIEPGTSR